MDSSKPWTALVHPLFLAVGLLGIVATAIVSPPGTGAFGVGPMRFDAFYVAIGAFGALVLASLSDPAEPDECNSRRSGGEQ